MEKTLFAKCIYGFVFHHYLLFLHLDQIIEVYTNVRNKRYKTHILAAKNGFAIT